MKNEIPVRSLRLADQVAVVTGGTRGIGEGIVRRFLQEGARVVFSGRSERKGKALEEELGENVVFYRADAASASETEALMKFAVEHFGRLDCVVNNAGVSGEALLLLLLQADIRLSPDLRCSIASRNGASLVNHRTQRSYPVSVA